MGRPAKYPDGSAKIEFKCAAEFKKDLQKVAVLENQDLSALVIKWLTEKYRDWLENEAPQILELRETASLIMGLSDEEAKEILRAKELAFSDELQDKEIAGKQPEGDL